MTRPIDVDTRLSVVCAVGPEEARAIRLHHAELTVEEVQARSGLPRDTAVSLLAAPGTVNDVRLDPNRTSAGQLARIPGMPPERVTGTLAGRPYYSLEELQLTTHLSRQLLGELFEVPMFTFHDKGSGREAAFSPVPDRYVVPPVDDFETAADGFAVIVSSEVLDGFRVVAAADFLSRSAVAPHELKARLGGDVHPVLRDGDGYERYLLPGHLDVWFRRDVPEEDRRTVLDGFACEVRDGVPSVGYYRVRLSETPSDLNVTRAVFDTVRALAERDEVLFSEPDQIGVEDFGPLPMGGTDEEEFLAADRRWSEEVIELGAAQALTRGSPRVTMLLVDAGCRMAHEDLQAVFHPRWRERDLNFVLGLPPEVASPDEQETPHGTMVAGVAARVAPGCRVLPLKVSGQAVAAAYGLRAAAIHQALDVLSPGERGVLNLSWRTNGEHIGIREALVEAQRREVPVVAAAGNYGQVETQRADEVHYPSGHRWLYPQLDNLCSVAAVAAGDRKASYSYYGGNSVTVSAPGGDRPLGPGTAIYTTSTPDPHAYTYGTSFAAPAVTGVLALVLSTNPGLSASEAVRIVEESADPIEERDPAFAGMLGAGRLNARRAVERAGGAAGPVTHTVTASAGPGGAIRPAGDIEVRRGEDVTLLVTPNQGSRVAGVLVDGRDVGTDGEVTLPAVAQDHRVEARFRAETADGGRTNLNTASVAELAALPFIGTWLAERIVEDREVHGPFGSVWALGRVGVGAWVIGQLAPHVTT